MGCRLPAWWWAALVVLLLNDHVLKGGGLLPPLVTGKASDFAGLIVAPVLACALLRARTRPARLAIFGVIGVAFAVVKTLPAATLAAGAALTAVGIPSRVWCDPTDLIALGVLPWVWRGLEPPVTASARPAHPGLADRVGIAIAALACVATSVEAPEDRLIYPPFLINGTRSSVSVELGVRFDASCGADAGDASVAELSAPALATSVTLDPAGLLELGEATDAGEGRCGVARVRVERGGGLTFAWDAQLARPRTLEVYERVDASAPRRFDLGGALSDQRWPFEHAVLITGSSERRQLVPALELTVIEREAAP